MRICRIPDASAATAHAACFGRRTRLIPIICTRHCNSSCGARWNRSLRHAAAAAGRDESGQHSVDCESLWGSPDQTVVNRWGGNLLFDELLAQDGFAVLHADNRGMGSRGRAFAQAAYRNFGPVQLEDQLTMIDAALGLSAAGSKAPGLVGLELGRHVHAVCHDAFRSFSRRRGRRTRHRLAQLRLDLHRAVPRLACGRSRRLSRFLRRQFSGRI